MALLAKADWDLTMYDDHNPQESVEVSLHLTRDGVIEFAVDDLQMSIQAWRFLFSQLEIYLKDPNGFIELYKKEA